MTKANNRKKILVYADWSASEKPLLVGSLYAEMVRGSEIFSFEYSAEWLQKNSALHLDPLLQNFTGTQHPPQEHSNFGIFLDSSPDRWGRVLMKRREAVLARTEQRKPRTLTESDFLLGVYDQCRMGALRFKLEAQGDFINSDDRLAVPPWSSIAELQYASLMIERSEDIQEPDYSKWLNQLIAPGSSLGGARPKASITDSKGELWIAKFPSAQDIFNIGAWEMVVHELAATSGLNVPNSQAVKFAGKHHTFLVKRFDRKKNKRIHFTSAMTMLGYRDGQSDSIGASYLEIADFIMRYGSEVNMQLAELWKRIVFFIAVSNTDDHLRNHGFLLTKTGWMLSPVYDVNPNPIGTSLSLNISEADNALNYELALETASYFRVNNKQAKNIVTKIQKAVGKWSLIARKYKITKTEIEEMSSAFRVG
ncbi:MAG: HipA domain-containing protein [Ignavibacteriaceae bacterium]|nr:HipA domain-containing protein [Ignavibacteriaceae bacterium]